MKNILSFWNLLFFSFSFLFAQEKYFLQTEETGGGEILSQKIYDGASLWGYINGGADLYLEYGFQKLYLQEIRKNQHLYKVEIFLMKDAEAAYGVFSISRFKCRSDSSLTVMNCQTPHHLQFVRGSCYISISNQHGSDEEQAVMLFLCAQIVRKIPPAALSFPDEWTDSVYQNTAHAWMIVKGPIGLMNSYPDWLEWFERSAFVRMDILPVLRNGSFVTLTKVRFSDETALSVFFASINIRPLRKGEWTLKEGPRLMQTGVFILSEKEIFFAQSDLPVNQLQRYLLPIKTTKRK